MNKNNMIAVIALVLVVVVALLVYDRTRTPETPMEKIAGSIERAADDISDAAKEAAEEIEDEIDDHTTTK
jgi:Sec-independent protein translocase protein TatA